MTIALRRRDGTTRARALRVAAIPVMALVIAGVAGTAPAGASSDAAVVEAAYQTLVNYFPSQAGTLGALYTEALGLIPDRPAKSDGQAVGLAAATNIITLRSGDGRMTPIGVTSSFPTLPPGPGVWRLTPPF